MSQPVPGEAVRTPRRWRRGCLFPALLILLALLIVPCCLLAIILAAAAQPGGLAVGGQSFSLAAELRPTQFTARLRYQVFGGDTLCYRGETLTLIYDPFEVRRVPACRCVISGPDYRYQEVPCWDD